jgi:DNA-directed RNA polymerase specialized sigma24 family protein
VVATSPAARQLLGELPERYRDAVLLHDVERLPTDEIVTRLGRSPKAVHSHVARGRALLAARLVRHDGT